MWLVMWLVFVAAISAFAGWVVQARRLGRGWGVSLGGGMACAALVSCLGALALGDSAAVRSCADAIADTASPERGKILELRCDTLPRQDHLRAVEMAEKQLGVTTP